MFLRPRKSRLHNVFEKQLIMELTKDLGEKLMGGYGSGRQRERNLITDFRFINVRWMNKQGLLKGKGINALNWSCNGRPWGKMEVLVDEDSIRLIYKESRNDGPWEDKNISIKLLKTPCQFGGYQYWFECPVCRRRVCTVYLSDVWCCRHCGHLAYPSENEDELERLRSKVYKLKEKLGEDYWIKPKGMHRKTYDRLREALLDAETKAEDAFDEKMRQLNQRLISFGKIYPRGG